MSLSNIVNKTKLILKLEKVAIFNWFELRTPSTPSIGSHPYMLAPCYWLKFFKNVRVTMWRGSLVRFGWTNLNSTPSRNTGSRVHYTFLLLSSMTTGLWFPNNIICNNWIRCFIFYSYFMVRRLSGITQWNWAFQYYIS